MRQEDGRWKLEAGQPGRIVISCIRHREKGGGNDEIAIDKALDGSERDVQMSQLGTLVPSVMCGMETRSPRVGIIAVLEGFECI